MKRTWLTGLLVGIGMCTVVFIVTGALQAQSAPQPTGRVACVNVIQVFSEYQRMKDVQEELKQLDARLNTEGESRQKAADDLQATIDVMDREDPTFLKKNAELLEMRIGLRTWAEVKKAHTAREIGLATDRIYRDIIGVCEQIARQAGYDIVLQTQPYQPMSMSPDEIEAQMQNRKVLFSSEAVDISDLVLRKLNADYRTQPPRPQLYVP
ncbi:MAG: OmpH family outer membrane protein [Planctomycetota bacterium]